MSLKQRSPGDIHTRHEANERARQPVAANTLIGVPPDHTRCRELAEQCERLTARVEQLRGALKTASAWVREGGDIDEQQANDRAEQLLAWAGDIEPSSAEATHAE